MQGGVEARFAINTWWKAFISLSRKGLSPSHIRERAWPTASQFWYSFFRIFDCQFAAVEQDIIAHEWFPVWWIWQSATARRFTLKWEEIISVWRTFLTHACPEPALATLKRLSLHADVTVECTSQLDANRREVVKDVEREVDLSIYRFMWTIF